jgi:hypothetical protein
VVAMGRFRCRSLYRETETTRVFPIHAESPMAPTSPIGSLMGLVSVGSILSGPVVSRDGDNLASNAPMNPMITVRALACRNNTVAICFSLTLPQCHVRD